MSSRNPPRVQRTKIVCTLGPASWGAESIRGLIQEGADCFRINLSHGNQEEHERTIARIREAARELDSSVAILLDLRGAKIRTTESNPSPFDLTAGSELEIAGGHDPSTPSRIHVTPALALQNLEAGHRILVDDGKIMLTVLEKRASSWRCRVDVGGPVQDRRGVTLVEVPTGQLPGLTEKDAADIEFGVRLGVDYFALSFVRSADDVRDAKREIARHQAEVPIIAKLEKPEALGHLPAILQEVDGVMVARGDLGVEAPLERVPVFQKTIIAAARRYRRPVITATQMLESMIEKPVPTRAEVSDVANAVFDGTDAVMLSGETSIGAFPREAVRMMARTASEAEAVSLRERTGRTFEAAERTFPDAIGAAACVAAESVDAKCILVYTASGYSAGLISSYRPSVPIYAFSPRPEVVRRLRLFWGVEPKLLDPAPVSVEDLVRRSEAALVDTGVVRQGETIALVAGVPLRQTGNTNFLKIHRVGETEDRASAGGS